jgi:hypothetical protein
VADGTDFVSRYKNNAGSNPASGSKYFVRLWYNSIMNCLGCGKETKNPKFCSLSCSAKTQNRDVFKKDKTKICNTCGIKFNYGQDPHRKFCSQSCSAKASNLGRAKKKTCFHCQILYSGSGKKFCSSKCSGLSQRKILIDAWGKNPSSATRAWGLSATIRRHLIAQSGSQCSLCAWGEINPMTEKSPLEVDHIDGDCYNNDLSNLRVLCPNCHSLTNTYKALNKNGKRKYRTGG